MTLRRGWGLWTTVIWAVCPALAVPVPTRAVTAPLPAVFAGTRGSVHTFAGATFSPAVAPVVTKTKSGKDNYLSWTAVSVRPGAVITYSVVRYRNGANPTAVCTGASAPVLSTGTVTCADTNPPNGSLTYSEQPTVTANGAATWSLSPSVPA